MRRIEILSSRKVYVRSFNNMCIESIILNAVKKIDTDGVDNVKVGTLTLKNMTIDSLAFISLIRATRPLGLVLEDVKCSNAHHTDFWLIFRALASLRILSLDIFNSFIDFELFRGIVRKLGIKHFSYMSEQPISLFRARTSHPSTCFIDQQYIFVDNIERVENLHICNQESVGCLSHPMPLLRCIKIDNVAIDDSLIRALGPIRKISLSNCTFRTVCFYDFIRWVSKTLRYISFRRTEIPLDGFAFMKKVLSRCQVVVFDVTSFYIDGSCNQK
jgi:hypothetical protein